MPEKKISSVIMIQHQDQIIHDVRRGVSKRTIYLPEPVPDNGPF